MTFEVSVQGFCYLFEISSLEVCLRSVGDVNLCIKDLLTGSFHRLTPLTFSFAGCSPASLDGISGGSCYGKDFSCSH